MDTPLIENTQGAIPTLGFGTFQLQGDTCRQAVKTALEVGYRLLDTARMYDNEEQVAAGIREAGVAREDIFLTSKLNIGAIQKEGEKTFSHPPGVRQSCEDSLSALATDVLDLLLIHWPDPGVPASETLGALAELQQEGKIRHFGISNFTVRQIEDAVEAVGESIFCNQVEYHPFLSQQPVLSACRDHDIIVEAYSPLARGEVLADETLRGIGAAHGKSPAQVAIRWLIQQQVVAIPKGTSEDHIRQNAEVFDFELSEEDMNRIADLPKDRRLIDPPFAPHWDT